MNQEQLIKQIDRLPAVRAACAGFEQTAAIINEAIAIQQIAAPTFAEGRRAEYVLQRFHELGLQDVGRDQTGNVYACRPGSRSAAALLIAAHLDTVFPAQTDLQIRREGPRIYGPGIGDNSLGVAALIHLAAALQLHNIRHQHDIWFVANVAEEGLGDLRGMRAAVDRLQGQLGAAIALEGCEQGCIFHEAIGVRRYRISASTAGGHSWSDFGKPSAIHALVRLATRLTELAVPEQPRSSFNIGVIEGGTSVNTIAQHASLLLDLRSADPAELARMVHDVESILAEAMQAHTGVHFDLQVAGDRPAGSIPRQHALVQAATAAYALAGAQISYEAGSTDANIPLSRGIPAVCVAVSHGNHAHRLDEYIEPARLPAGMQALLLLTLAAAGGVAG